MNHLSYKPGRNYKLKFQLQVEIHVFYIFSHSLVVNLYRVKAYFRCKFHLVCVWNNILIMKNIIGFDVQNDRQARARRNGNYMIFDDDYRY